MIFCLCIFCWSVDPSSNISFDLCPIVIFELCILSNVSSLPSGELGAKKKSLIAIESMVLCFAELILKDSYILIVYLRSYWLRFLRKAEFFNGLPFRMFVDKKWSEVC